MIIATETWLSTVTLDSMINIEGYSNIRQDRGTVKKRTWGGIICYIKNDIPYIVNGNIQANNDDCEIICIELKTPKAKRLNFIIVYRPPTGNIKNMIDYLEEAVGRLNRERTENRIE